MPILASIGGANAVGLLLLLHVGRAVRRPRVVMGYSDIATLLHGSPTRVPTGNSAVEEVVVRN
jgi:muramoyltetrapeptide carboxypeptidase LdcA involved in peptidoglycan recycling